MSCAINVMPCLAGYTDCGDAQSSISPDIFEATPACP
jgi:hypothetical protein